MASSDRLAELTARMKPEDVAAARRVADEAPPLTAEQIGVLRSLLGPLTRHRLEGAA